MNLQPGNRIRDNHPSRSQRVLRIERITTSGPFGGHRWAVCTDGQTPREHRIRIDRIHADGKARRTGFSLLPEGSP